MSVRPTPITLDLAALTEKMVVAVDPLVTIPRRGLSIINIPPWVRELIGDDFGEIMAYPKIDVPMYGPLKVSFEGTFPAQHQLHRAEQHHAD